MDVKLETRKNTLSEVTNDTPAVSTQTKHAAQDIAFGSVSKDPSSSDRPTNRL